MSAQHTPGPWQKSGWVSDWSQPYREDSKTSTVLTVVGTDGEAVAMAVICYEGWTDKKKDAELESNARLIAAAPDLLDALRGVLKVADRATVEFDAARAAIAKATGVTA